MSSSFLVLLLALGVFAGSEASPKDPVDLLVRFFNILYSDSSLDFQYDFGARSQVLNGNGLVSVWGPMELRHESQVLPVDNFTRLVHVGLNNTEHILINANTYDDLKLHGCQIHLQLTIEVVQGGTTIRPLTLEVHDCQRVSYDDGSTVPEVEEVLRSLSEALLSKAREHLQFYFSGSPRLDSFDLDQQRNLFAALLFYA